MPSVDVPALVACAHGTRDPAGRRALALLRLDAAALRPDVEVLAANVDVQKPALDAVVRRLSAQGRRCVVVPLLLAAGYHVAVDVTEAVEASGGLAVAAAALGPHEVLLDVLADRLAQAGVAGTTPLVLGAAGSSDARAVADVEEVARSLAARRGSAVTAAYLSAASPTVAQVLAQVLAQPSAGPVAVANFLLAPGFFADRLAAAAQAADVPVTSPLAPHPLLAGLVVRRYEEAVAAARW